MSSGNPITKAAIAMLRASIGKIYNISDTTETFAIEPTMDQRIEQKLSEAVDFLGLINVFPVEQLQGAVLGMFAPTMIGSTMSTGNNPDGTPKRRLPKDVSGLDSRQYQLFENLFDTMMPWEKLDLWAKFPNFAALYSAAVAKAIGHTRMSIGFNGLSHAATSDSVNNPLGQDINVGWLQQLRLTRPSHVMGRALAGPAGSQTATGAAVPVNIGPAQPHKNIDSLVMDMISGLPTWAQNSPDLEVIMSRNMLNDKYFGLVNRPLSATLDGGAMLADDVIAAAAASTSNGKGSVAGRPVCTPAFFPDHTILVSPLKNLSIYYQTGGRRRYIRDEPEFRRGLVDYNSSNEGYVIELTDFAVMAENITAVP